MAPTLCAHLCPVSRQELRVCRVRRHKRQECRVVLVVLQEGRYPLLGLVYQRVEGH